jgi:hypothetical protein
MDSDIRGSSSRRGSSPEDEVSDAKADIRALAAYLTEHGEGDVPFPLKGWTLSDVEIAQSYGVFERLLERRVELARMAAPVTARMIRVSRTVFDRSRGPFDVSDATYSEARSLKRF